MEAPIVTLTTDWGNDGLFSGMVKGKLYSLIDHVRVVDITHNLAPYDLIDASFVVQHALTGFPPGTVHIIDIASNDTPDEPFIVAKFKEQYYICTDNGLPDRLFADRADDISIIDINQTSNFYNFAAYDLFCTVASMLCHGATMRDIGEPHLHLNNRRKRTFIVSDNMVEIYIVHTDSYGNAYLGISYDEFEQLRAGRKFELNVRGIYLHHLCHSYYDHIPNDPSRQKLRLTVSATGLLELAITQGSFSQLVGLTINDRVILRFKD